MDFHQTCMAISFEEAKELIRFFNDVDIALKSSEINKVK